MAKRRGEFAMTSKGPACFFVTPVRVRIMARAEGYAMVRRPGGFPFTVSEKDLTPPLARAALSGGGK